MKHLYHFKIGVSLFKIKSHNKTFNLYLKTRISVRTSKKLQRNSPSMTENEKKRSTEDKSSPKKDSEKKFKTEGEKEKKKIDLDEEKEVLEKYLSQKHSLSKQKIRWIIEERAEKYIDWDT